MGEIESRLYAPSPSSGEMSWRGLTGYSILTPAFQDSNNDGIGDIPGITQRLDYLRNLGIDVIHLTPFYPTHLYDIGYDVDDYRDIDPRYGNLKDFKELVDASHSKGIKVVTDMVINHTSTHHRWFEESRRSRDNPKREYYIWRDSKPDGSPPNNWVANFGGPAWEFDEATGQWFLHTFLPEQADLNYENPNVRKEMIEIMHFWADLGVDGFRLDSLPFIRKAEGLPDAQVNPDFDAKVDHPTKRVFNNQWWFQPKMLEDLQAFCASTDKFICSEAYPPASHKGWVQELYQAAPLTSHAVINSGFVGREWTAEQIAGQLVDDAQRIPDAGVNMPQKDNHDTYRRFNTRAGSEHERTSAMLLVTTPGVPWLYYGEEIGIDAEAESRDPDNPFQTHTFSRFDPDTRRNKDASRSVMAWDNSDFSGFSSLKPVLPVATNFMERNVARQQEDPRSLWNLYRKLIDFRRRSDAIRNGSLTTVQAVDDILSYVISSDETEIEVTLNFSGERKHGVTPTADGKIVLSTELDTGEAEKVAVRDYELRPYEGVIFERARHQ